jgi:hypothetical protein
VLISVVRLQIGDSKAEKLFELWLAFNLLTNPRHCLVLDKTPDVCMSHYDYMR